MIFKSGGVLLPRRGKEETSGSAVLEDRPKSYIYKKRAEPVQFFWIRWRYEP